jgi:hypothetical protein
VPLGQGSWDGTALTGPFDKEALKTAPHHDPGHDAVTGRRAGPLPPWDIAGERALAAKKLASKKLSGKSEVADTDAPMPVDDTDAAVANGPSVGTPDQAAAATGSAADGAAATGFGGRTVAEDSHAAITGMSAPPPAGRVPPTDPTTGRP